MIRYPIINGELPPMEPITEYHIVSGSGVVSCTFDQFDLAKTRFDQINDSRWKLLEVTRRVRDITPAKKKRKTLELVA
jgi:hypothetical protein